MMLLQVHCGAQVTSEHQQLVEGYLKLRRSPAKRLAKLAKNLRRVGAETEQITGEIDDVAPEVRVAASRQYGRPLTQPDEIQSYLSCLEDASRQLRALSLRTAPMYALHQIQWYMKGNARKVDREELALLLEIGYSAFGVKKSLSAEDVRALLKRAPQKIPNWARQESVTLILKPDVK